MESNLIKGEDNFWYEIKENESGRNVYIIAHWGKQNDLVVPEKVGNHTISRVIGFTNKEASHSNVKTVTIPESVKVIDRGAFEGISSSATIYCYSTTEFPDKDNFHVVYTDTGEEFEPILPEKEEIIEEKDEITLIQQPIKEITHDASIEASTIATIEPNNDNVVVGDNRALPLFTIGLLFLISVLFFVKKRT